MRGKITCLPVEISTVGNHSNNEGREVSNGHSSPRVRTKDQTLITFNVSQIRKGRKNCRKHRTPGIDSWKRNEKRLVVQEQRPELICK